MAQGTGRRAQGVRKTKHNNEEYKSNKNKL